MSHVHALFTTLSFSSVAADFESVDSGVPGETATPWPPSNATPSSDTPSTADRSSGATELNESRPDLDTSTVSTELDTDGSCSEVDGWGQGLQMKRGRWSWILGDDRIPPVPSPTTLLLGNMLLCVYHSDVHVVTAVLMHLRSLLSAGLFCAGKLHLAAVLPTTSFVVDSCFAPFCCNVVRRYDTDTRFQTHDVASKGFLPLLDVVAASVIDSCCSRIDAVHEHLNQLLVSIARFHGAESPMPTFHGMHPLTLYRCIDAAMRSYNYFCRKKVYALYMLSSTEGVTKQKEIETRQQVSPVVTMQVLSCQLGVARHSFTVCLVLLHCSAADCSEAGRDWVPQGLEWTVFGVGGVVGSRVCPGVELG
jgi:hypothetical protein